MPSSVKANNIENGSFETGVNLPPINSFGGVSATSTRQIDGWTVTSGAIDWVGRLYWEASDGNYSIDLNAASPGAISTSFSTVVGENYTLSFDVAGNPDGGPTVKNFDLAIANVNRRFAFDTSGYSRSNMGWKKITLRFTASAVTTNLKFIGVSPGASGAAIDNVEVSVMDDLAFIPVTPCRIVDTRKATAGIILKS
jgi:choice-of-anchor C domain-containing protein